MNSKTRRLVLLGVLIGMMLLFGFTPIGIISIPPANATIMHIPVIIGTLVLGWSSGLVLGACFGAISVFVAFTRTSVLVAPLLGAAPALVVVMSVGARLLVPVVAYLVYRAVSARDTKRRKIAAGVAAAAGTLTNTVCYLGLMYWFYSIAGLDSAAVRGVIAGAGALNGSVETIIAVVLCIPIVTALKKVYKNNKLQENKA